MISNLIKKNKKKGFTLVELIIVIVILAILALILIPQIGSYRQKAEKSNIEASAKSFKNAIDAYNADQPTPVTDIATLKSTLTSATGGASAALDGSNFPQCLDGSHEVTTMDQLNRVVNGNFTVTNATGTTSTIHIN